MTPRAAIRSPVADTFDLRRRARADALDHMAWEVARGVSADLVLIKLGVTRGPFTWDRVRSELIRLSTQMHLQGVAG